MARKNAKPSKPAQEPVIVKIPIEWNVENAPVVFANHMMVQLDEHECYLSFFELKPPLLVGEEADKTEQLKKIATVKASCKVQVVISRERVGVFASALQEIADKIKAKQTKSSDKPVNGTEQ